MMALWHVFTYKKYNKYEFELPMSLMSRSLKQAMTEAKIILSLKDHLNGVSEKVTVKGFCPDRKYINH